MQIFNKFINQHTRSGKPLTSKDIEALEEQEQKKEVEVCQVEKYFYKKIMEKYFHFCLNWLKHNLGSFRKYSPKTSSEKARISFEAKRGVSGRTSPHRL